MGIYPGGIYPPGHIAGVIYWAGMSVLFFFALIVDRVRRIVFRSSIITFT